MHGLEPPQATSFSTSPVNQQTSETEARDQRSLELPKYHRQRYLKKEAIAQRDNLSQDASQDFHFDSIHSALEEITAGRFVVVLDDAHRENEGDLVAAAELVTAESIAFMVEHTSGVICIGMEGADLDRLKLPLMVPPSENTDAKCTAFTITCDLRNGTTTGISASDRAKTLNALAKSDTQPADLRRPGHIFPLRHCSNPRLQLKGVVLQV